MPRLTAEKLDQAVRLVAESDFDVWLVFVRETYEGGDPALPLIFEGGMTWQSAFLVGKNGRKVAVVGNFDAGPIAATGDWDEVVPYVQGIRGPLIGALEKVAPGSSAKIGINYSEDDVKADGLSHGMFLLLTQYLEGTKFQGSLVSAAGVATALRSRKTPEEITRMLSAIDETDRLFDWVDKNARIGMSELELFEALQSQIDARRLGYSWDRSGDPIVNFGPDSMAGHSVPSSEIKLAPGQILHIDLGVIKDGYSSDIQSCWYVPHPGEESAPEDALRAAEAVIGAISAGAEALRPGAQGWEVDAAARSFLVGQGYPEYLHAFGHQVGRVAHDGGAILGPRWERYGKTPSMQVHEDEVYTLELGVNVEGRGYLGIEEMVQVKGGRLEWLTKRQTELPVLKV